MSSFTNECNNNTLNTEDDGKTSELMVTNTDQQMDVHNTDQQMHTHIDEKSEYQISIPNHPTPEQIGECSPCATFTTYKMGGSSGIYGKENQDACSVISIKKNGIKYAVTTVCDGHGLYGQSYSNTVVTLLPQLVSQRFSDVLADPFTTLKDIFLNVTNQVKQQMGYKNGGTTATITILTDGCLIVANVGDCEALVKIDTVSNDVILERNGVTIPNVSPDNIIRTTVDHNISNYDEVVRVINAGAQIKYASTNSFVPQVDVFTKLEENGKVKFVQNPHSNQIGGFISNLSKDPAVYFHGGASLNMTRSIGDWSAYYVIAEPDITRVTWTPGKRARLLVASDGYFNCFSKEDQHNELSFDLKPSEICERGHVAVGKTFGHKYADNTTIVVLDSVLN